MTFDQKDAAYTVDTQDYEIGGGKTYGDHLTVVRDELRWRIHHGHNPLGAACIALNGRTLLCKSDCI